VTSINYIYYGVFLIPFALLILFFISKLFKPLFPKRFDSDLIKGLSYGGLGIVIILYILAMNPADKMIQSYVAAMCFIEFIDLCIGSKISVFVCEKLKRSYQRVKIEISGPCLELKTIGAPENKKQ
jgi:hypothetical protein